MSPWVPWRMPSVMTRRGRQIEMQSWRCCFCEGGHAWWFHGHPGRDGPGRLLVPEEKEPSK